MYDEFGNLKKKFRAKAHQTEMTVQGGSGRAGWEVEDLGTGWHLFKIFSHNMLQLHLLEVVLGFYCSNLNGGKCVDIDKTQTQHEY